MIAAVATLGTCLAAATAIHRYRTRRIRWARRRAGARKGWIAR